MRLSDKAIFDYLDNAELIIFGPRKGFPFEPKKQVQPCSIDLRLDSHFYRFKDGIDSFDVRNLKDIDNYIESFHVDDLQPIAIPAGSVLFGQIYEQIRLPPTVSGKIVGRSRCARLGLAIHATGDFINPEFEGAMPLQLINHNRIPLVIYPMLTICQLILVELTSRPITPYTMRSDNPYHRERHASPSVLHRDPVLVADEVLGLGDAIRERMLEKYVRQRASSALVKDISSIFNGKQADIPRSATFVISNSQIGMVTSDSAVGTASAIVAAKANSLEEDASAALQAIVEFLGDKQSGLMAIDRDEAANIVGDLAKQLTLPKDEQASQGTLRLMVNRMAELIKTSAAGCTLWQHWGAQFLSLFS